MKHTRTRLASAFLVVALAAPIAQATIPHEVGSPTQGPAPVAGAALIARQGPPPIIRMDGQPAAFVRPITMEGAGGFDWADAGVGFGAAAGLVLIGAGSAVVLRRNRRLASPVH